jgi:AcrR family transcriptional regulator
MPTPETKRKRNARGEGTRLKVELIEAAMRVLDDAPDTSLSLRMVARAAGIAAPSVYRQFADARSMMTEIVQECWLRMAYAMEEAARELAQTSALVRLKARMRGFVLYAMERPSRYQLLFAMRPIDPSAGVGMPGPLAPAYLSVEKSLTAIAEEGGPLPAPDVWTSALLVLSIAHGRIALGHLAPNRPGNSAQSVAAFVSNAIDLLFAPKTEVTAHRASSAS